MEIMIWSSDLAVAETFLIDDTEQIRLLNALCHFGIIGDYAEVGKEIIAVDSFDAIIRKIDK